MSEFTCDICHAPMILDHRFATRHNRGKSYRVRRFKCSVCDFMKTIFGDGSGDEVDIPAQAIDLVKKIYEQEQINREI